MNCPKCKYPILDYTGFIPYEVICKKCLRPRGLDVIIYDNTEDDYHMPNRKRSKKQKYKSRT